MTLQDPKQQPVFFSLALDIKEAAILTLGSIAEVTACQVAMQQVIGPVLA